MVRLFLGLCGANILLLGSVFVLGLGTKGASGRPTELYPYHLALGVLTGLLTTLVHVAVYTYFMATTKWLGAATNKAALDPAQFLEPAVAAKQAMLPLVLLPVVATMLTMFAGAGADPTMRPWWPSEVHLVLAAACIALNVLCHVLQYHRIGAQGVRVDRALAAMKAA